MPLEENQEVQRQTQVLTHRDSALLPTNSYHETNGQSRMRYVRSEYQSQGYRDDDVLSNDV